MKNQMLLCSAIAVACGVSSGCSISQEHDSIRETVPHTDQIARSPSAPTALEISDSTAGVLLGGRAWARRNFLSDTGWRSAILDECRRAGRAPVVSGVLVAGAEPSRDSHKHVGKWAIARLPQTLSDFNPGVDVFVFDSMMEQLSVLDWLEANDVVVRRTTSEQISLGLHYALRASR